MKVLAIFTFALMAFCVKSDKEMMMKIMEECKTKVGATDEDVGKMMMHTPPDNQQQKCMFNCIMEGIGCMKDGKLTEEGFMHMANKMTNGDADKLKVAKDVFGECANIGDADPCEAAVKIGFCVKTNAEKRKVTLIP